MKRKIFLGLVFVCFIILSIQLGKQILPDVFGIIPKGGLKVIAGSEATVYLNGLEVGKTPYTDENLTTGEYLVKLIGSDSTWQGKITLNKGTLSVINRSLAPTVASSSGESLVLDSGSGVIITSSPSDSKVEIDGKAVGYAPLSLVGLLPGAHSLNISHDNYLTRKVEIVLPANLSLNINVDLALAERKENNVAIISVVPIQKVRVKQTPLGYLRLREGPSVSSKELAQVSSGEELEVIAEVKGWIKVKLANNQEGYISTQYTQKLP